MTERVELELPYVPHLLSMARLCTGSVGTALDLTLEEVDDLQLAVDELVMLTMSGAKTSEERFVLRFEWDDRTVWVECEPRDRDSQRDPAHAESDGTVLLSKQILDALVEDHGTRQRDGRSVGWLCQSKRLDPDQ